MSINDNAGRKVMDSRTSEELIDLLAKELRFTKSALEVTETELKKAWDEVSVLRAAAIEWKSSATTFMKQRDEEGIANGEMIESLKRELKIAKADYKNKRKEISP